MTNFAFAKLKSTIKLPLSSFLAIVFAAVSLLSMPASVQPASAETTISQVGLDIDGEAANDFSGYSVSLSSDGSTVAIGARDNDGNGSDAGHVRIYSYDSESGWTQVGSDIDGEAAGDQFGYSVSLSSDGSRVAIGAPYNDGGGSNAGHVRIYDYNGSSWTQSAIINGEAAGDQSGYSVSLSSDGSRVAIGAIYNDGGGSNAGHVRIYDYNGSSWTQSAIINGEAVNGFSGKSVSLSSDGSTVAIGAQLYNDGNAGHVRIYSYDSESGWTQVGGDIDGEAAGDMSGNSVSLSSDGSRVAIGALYNDGNGINAGHVRVYSYNSESGWTQVGSDIDGEAREDFSGYSVALSSDGSTVAIGATGNDDNGISAGHVRIYRYNGSNWIQDGNDIDGEAAGDRSGYSVALSGDSSRVAIGAPYNVGNGWEAGHVRIFSAIELEAALTPTFATPTQTSDGFTVQVSNYDANFTWNVSASVGSAAIGGSGLISVTGLSAGASSTVTVQTTRSGYTAGSATVPSSALDPAPSGGSAGEQGSQAAAYSGPTFDAAKTVAAGSEVTFTGRRLQLVSSAYAGQLQLQIVQAVSSSLTVFIPTSLSANVYDLTVHSSNGKLTFQQGLTVLGAQDQIVESEAGPKLTVGSFKGYVAIYTKGYEGQKLSAKVDGKWLVVDPLKEFWRQNNYSRTVRFIGAGYDIFVHLYVDGEFIKTEMLTTK